jgi:hypothetical protein
MPHLRHLVGFDHKSPGSVIVCWVCGGQLGSGADIFRVVYISPFSYRSASVEQPSAACIICTFETVVERVSVSPQSQWHTQEFCSVGRGGWFTKISLGKRAERTGILGHWVPLNLQMSETYILIKLLRMYFLQVLHCFSLLLIACSLP